MLSKRSSRTPAESSCISHESQQYVTVDAHRHHPSNQRMVEHLAEDGLLDGLCEYTFGSISAERKNQRRSNGSRAGDVISRQAFRVLLTKT